MLVKNTVLMACAAMALAACGTTTPSQQARHEPPRMIHHAHNNYSYMWDYPDRFGGIPSSEAERAARECNLYKAGSAPIGYTAHALDIAGNPIAGGGFSCRD